MTLLLAHDSGDAFGGFSGWAFILRFGQQLLQLAPHLLFGAILAGLLRTRTGHRWLSSCLDGSWPRSMPRAIVLGMITPVGTLGSLPIASEMLRAGIRPSVVVCFLVTAPLFMPWSFGYAADALGVLNALLVVLAGSLLAFVTGTAARWVEGVPHAMPQQTLPPTKSQLFTILQVAARHISGGLLVYVLLALTAYAGLAAMLKAGSIEAHLGESSMGTLFQLSIPIALGTPEPDAAVVYASEFWRVGLLTGGIFFAFYLGAGWSLGAFAWCIHRLRRTGVIVTIVWLLVAMGIAAVGNSFVHAVRPGEPDSHAFDMLTKPYNFGGTSPAAGVATQLGHAVQGKVTALAALVALFAFGVLDRTRSRRSSTAHFGNTPPSSESSRVPQPAIRATLLGAVGVCLVVSVLSYFPPPEELHDRMRQQSGNLFGAVSVLNSPQRTPEEKHAAEMLARNALDRMDDALDRYPISRAVHLADSSQAYLDAKQLRHQLKQLEHLVTAGASEQLMLATIDLAEQLTHD